ncbi:hypothetical protein L2E82_16780 [Cichorium intybus]|uniref:Uncharacterized protein n=1 Tax=Cichorium intybus TaxID=13427 RepID=A0ACB9F6G7_CICIN|nr:hypothetical protein L2E82_16780 [Cichorium intybus]
MIGEGDKGEDEGEGVQECEGGLFRWLAAITATVFLLILPLPLSVTLKSFQEIGSSLDIVLSTADLQIRRRLDGYRRRRPVVVVVPDHGVNDGVRQVRLALVCGWGAMVAPWSFQRERASTE